jgi:hypothetical protein
MPRITSACAREYARRSAEVRRQGRLDAEWTNGKDCLENLPDDPWLRYELLEQRKLIAHVHRLLRSAKDTNDICHLVSALCKLCECERITEGRPLPGTYKPVPPKPYRPLFSGPE